jgi:hypothetical protein
MVPSWLVAYTLWYSGGEFDTQRLLVRSTLQQWKPNKTWQYIEQPVSFASVSSIRKISDDYR